MNRDKIYAIHIIDNWDGEGDRYWIFARKHEDGYFVSEETGKPLIQYEGDQILHVVPLSENQEPVAWLVRERTFCGDVTTNKDSADFCEQLTPGSTTPLYTRPSPSVSALVEALEFYARGDHLLLGDENAWESVTGDPQNWIYHETIEAGVEIGEFAEKALATYRNQEGES